MTIAAPTERSPFVFASALAIDVATMKLVPEADTVAHETEIVLDRIAARLAASGLTLGDVVKTTCYLRDESDRPQVSEVYSRAFGPGRLPVNCTVFLGLAGDCRVQVDVVAARKEQATS